jgi:hypothetical protein
MGSDIEIGISGLTEALNSNYPYRLIVKEEYGEPPSIQSAGTTSDLRLYNGLQEYIPYDIAAYGGGNAQWMLSGISYTVGWIDTGDYTVETGSFSSGDVKFTSNGAISGITAVQISYKDKDGNDSTAKINHIAAGDYVKFQKDANNAFILQFATQTTAVNYTTWSDITYVSKTSAMQLSGFTNQDVIGVYHANYDTGDGYGKYLTDALDFQVDTWDYANLYFFCTTANRPAYCRVRVQYWGIPGYEEDEEIGIGNVTANAQRILARANAEQSAPNPPTYEKDPGDDIGSPIAPIFKPQISSYYTGYTLTPYETSANNMYYFPTGPKELGAKGIFTRAGDKWIAYQIDLTDGLDGSAKVYTKYPMTYYRKCKNTNYNPLQVFWINPHGGFDRYTFYKKNYIEYDVERTVWQHRFSDTYTLGERGKTVYKVKADEKITLNTDYLTASESQTLSQLMMSPEVYVVYEYRSRVYKIPYLVVDTKFQYKDIKNEKMVSMEIQIEPAWNRVSQTS